MSSESAEPMKAVFGTYRTSLALNNMAITLMRKGCFRPALETLTESVKLMKTAFRDSNKSTKHSSKARVEKISQAAERRCSKPATKRSHRAFMEIRALDDSDFAALRSAAAYGPSMSVVSPITIGESPSPYNGMEGTADARDVGRQLGIILYNHGLACLLVAVEESAAQDGTLNNNQSTAKASIQKLLAASMKSLLLSSRTFARLLAPQENKDDDTPSKSAVVESSLRLLSALVLNCQSSVFRKQNMLEQAKEAEYLVSVLCSDVDQDCFSSVLLRQESAPAA